MSNKRKKYVSAEKIKKINADYLLLLGERANGKSYAIKSNILTSCYEDPNTEFIYLRRFDLDIKDSVAVNYFADMPVYEITNGEYSCVDVFRKAIYFANVDEETGKVIRGRKIGYCHALSGAEHYKSLAYPKVEYIDFEEFISVDGHYLFNEPDKLQHYVSTIFRHKKGKVYLVGNTISRICPYYREWGLEKGLKKQKQGEIVYYSVDQTNIAVYLTDSLNYNSGMFFGNIANNITKGAYETFTLPHLPKPKFKFKVLYQFVLEYNEFKFLCELLQDAEVANQIVWYVQPKTSEVQPRTRVISNAYNISPWYVRTFKDLTPKEKQVIELLNNDQVCYSDNLTGTEFINIMKNFR